MTRQIIFCAVGFIAGVIAVTLASLAIKKKKKTQKAKIGVMDLILIIVGLSLLFFTVGMILLYREFGSIPDTLVSCVFAVLGGECGVMGWIKTTKERYKDREWQEEDRAKEMASTEEDDHPSNDL